MAASSIQKRTPHPRIHLGPAWMVSETSQLQLLIQADVYLDLNWWRIAGPWGARGFWEEEGARVFSATNQTLPLLALTVTRSF